jgi:hypothetical protein
MHGIKLVILSYDAEYQVRMTMAVYLVAKHLEEIIAQAFEFHGFKATATWDGLSLRWNP